jgi:GrpB-like predicted nucleotidyltransferase (UPF0157 family)
VDRVHFEREERFRERVDAAWRREAGHLHVLLPGADLQHVGSSAIPGSLTKGDLDIQVRVPTAAFPAAEAALAAYYPRNTGSSVVPGFAAFELRGPPVDVGIQLTIIDGPCDFFWRFREVLLAREQQRVAYDELKRAHEGGLMDAYRRAKERFFEDLRQTAEYAAARLPESCPTAIRSPRGG